MVLPQRKARSAGRGPGDGPARSGAQRGDPGRLRKICIRWQAWSFSIFRTRARRRRRLPEFRRSAGSPPIRTASGEWRGIGGLRAPEAALPYFEAEQKNFPRSAVNLRLWQSVLEHLGRREEAGRLEERWLELMTRKGLRPEEFPYLLRNQILDDSPLELRTFLEELRK